MSSVLAQQLTESAQLGEWVADLTAHVTIRSDRRSRLAIQYLDVAAENQRAVGLLLTKTLIGPALTVLRMTFEAYVRGAWVSRCATEDDLTRLELASVPRMFASLIYDLARTGSPATTASVIAERYKWASENNFLYAGFVQVQRHRGDDAEEDTSSDLLESVQLADQLLLLSALEISYLGSNEDVGATLLERLDWRSRSRSHVKPKAQLDGASD